MSDVFHLGLTRPALDGATLAIVPGDPDRVDRIAQHLDTARPLGRVREFASAIGSLSGTPVVVCSTGIGGPSTSIAVEELAQLGVTTFLRVGTTGAIQPHIAVGDTIISHGSVRLDGASHHFAPPTYPAVADFDCTRALVDAAARLGVTAHVGVTASSDTFYPGQERYDTVSGRVLERWRGSMNEWRALGVLNYEMESATLFTMCATQGLRAGCVAGVIVNRTEAETPDDAIIGRTEQRTVDVVVEAARGLLAER